MKNRLKNFKIDTDPFWLENGYGTRFQKFQNLMRYRIRDVLIVSSLYDLYIFEEDGRLYELIRSEYQGLNLSHTPELTHVSNGGEAIKLIREEKRFDLIVTTLHIEDMQPATFAKKIRQEGITLPIIMLAFDNRELADMLAHKENLLYDQIFIWLGNFRLLLAIIKYLEDRHNVEHDTHIMGVQSIIIIEDNIRDYSFFLPTVFIEIINQSQRAIREGMSLSNKNLRQRARPKIILNKNYEDAWRYYEKYHDTVLGIISDIGFPYKGKYDHKAGLKFAANVRKMHPDISVLLHSFQPSNEKRARELGCEFLSKSSPTFLLELKQSMAIHFGFGDFVFRRLDRSEAARASDLISLEKQLKVIPDESLVYHSERNHFSNWLKARTEFWLAHKLRPRKVTDFASISHLRKHIIASLREYRKSWQKGVVTDFDRESFDPKSSISRIGEGSLGGKARGITFFNTLINSFKLQNMFEKVKIFVPPAIVLTTDIFEQFLDENDLLDFALNTSDDKKILGKFLNAEKFPENAAAGLKAFLELVKKPLAVRSSSLLEDSHNFPFAGVYGTYMLPNSHRDIEVRVSELIMAVKHVFASTYFSTSKDYIKATSFRLEEEKMAVIVQVLCGAKHENRFYPTFSGTARSYNFYPVTPQKSADGIASVALGLGKMVVEGGSSLRFSPIHPRHTMQFSSPKLALENNQYDFYALDLEKNVRVDHNDNLEEIDYFIKKHPLQIAEKDGVLNFVGSTYSPQNDVIYDDISSPGIRLVSFSPILKYDIFPLAEILELLLDLGSWGMGTPVEIEFAVEMDVPKNKLQKFSLLQIRPMILHRELEVLTFKNINQEKLICQSNQVMGNGIIDNVYDIILVDRNRYDRSKSRDAAREIKLLNSKLIEAKKPYLLVGVGRWGSQDPWLGIPVSWDQISGARAIIETGFRDIPVTPSQGSHFFENLNSFMVGYFTVQTGSQDSYIDWQWLLDQKPVEELAFTKHLHFDKQIIIKMNGRKNQGIIVKPE